MDGRDVLAHQFRNAQGEIFDRYAITPRHVVNAADGRIVRLRATDAGKELCGKIEGDLAREYARMLEDFDPEVRQAMIRLVGRLAASFAARVDASGGSCCVVR